ncbi:hypothetical protein HPB48_019828 [Haemaphysalis longicornis]|uniref:Uncharacterized protein n=1 Tax=Haemaphysalis longicornis TaxID=44386 RepID=A0A9J6GIB8_HAELO|nr:hypothetical protein HPB48_019828 [Haemaphysalis longicornis]
MGASTRFVSGTELMQYGEGRHTQYSPGTDDADAITRNHKTGDKRANSGIAPPTYCNDAAGNQERHRRHTPGRSFHSKDRDTSGTPRDRPAAPQGVQAPLPALKRRSTNKGGLVSLGRSPTPKPSGRQHSPPPEQRQSLSTASPSHLVSHSPAELLRPTPDPVSSIRRYKLRCATQGQLSSQENMDTTTTLPSESARHTPSEIARSELPSDIPTPRRLGARNRLYKQSSKRRKGLDGKPKDAQYTTEQVVDSKLTAIRTENRTCNDDRPGGAQGMIH